MKSLFRRTGSFVGLDIGSSAVKVVEIVPRLHGPVAKVGCAPTPSGSIVDGAIVEPERVAGAIRQAFTAGGIRKRRVAIALPGSAVIIKRIALPPTRDARLADVVTREASRYLPFDPDNLILDYHRIGASARNLDDPIDLLLVAARRETVVGYAGAVAELGCTPTVVDVGALALQNVFEWTDAGETDTSADVPDDASVALLDVGASATTVNVVRGGASLFTHDVPAGGNACTEALQRELDLSFEAAERLKLGLPARGRTMADAAPIIRGAADTLALEVRRTLELVAMGTAGEGTEPVGRIDRIVLTGGASRADGFEAALRTHFGGVVKRLDPFRRLTVRSPAAGDSAGANALRTSASIAVGLALRTVDER